jgi:prepilin-type N-terminal cleavage/methylation domain-containing protein
MAFFESRMQAMQLGRKVSVRKSCHEAGFTIVELLMAMIVISVMIVSISDLYIGIERSQRKTALVEAATRAGMEKIEGLRNNNYVLIPPGTVLDFTSELPDSIPSPRSASVAVSEPASGLRQLEVRITISHGSTTQDIRLTSIIGDIGTSS